MESKEKDASEVINSMNTINSEEMENINLSLCKDDLNIINHKANNKQNDDSFIFPYSKKLKQLEKDGSSTWLTNEFTSTLKFNSQFNTTNLIVNSNHALRANSTHGLLQSTNQRFNSMKQNYVEDKYMSSVNFNKTNNITNGVNVFPNSFQNNSNISLQSNFTPPSNFNSGSTYNLNQYAPHYNQYCNQSYNFIPQVGYSNTNFPFPTYYTQPLSYTPYLSNQQLRPNVKSSTSFKESNKSNQTQQSNSIVSSKKSKFKSKIEYECLTDDEIQKIIPLICKEQAGCRYLQDKIENIPEYAEKVLLPVIYNNFLEVTNNQFGNYLMQKILDSITIESFNKVKNIVSKII
jgi:hypothetical protein